MALVEVYIYDKKTGLFLYQDCGNPAQVTLLDDNRDFTLKKPPMDGKRYRWADDRWELPVDEG